MKEFVKNIIHRTGYRVVKNDFLNRHYHRADDPRYRPSGDLDVLEQLFYRYLDNDFFFIQVGANNGKRYDPIHHLLSREKEKVTGIAIEPAKEYFEELKETYKEFPRIKLLNAAIHNAEKEMWIYKINPELDVVPEHFKGMASFDKFNFIKEGVKKSDLLEEKVCCLSLMELVEQEGINRISLLQVDAEGYDLEIIRSIDFNRVKPLVINFEHRWQYDLIEAGELFSTLRMLINHGYSVVLNGNDALAYLNEG